MGAVSKESGVLKLVYPGGFVELHRKPITAAEVMKRTPRHCVARPDVFKFPWIVVKPESVLKPGRVFYIVPFHTLHHLLRSKGSRLKTLTAAEDSCPRQKVTSRIESWKDDEDSRQLGHGWRHGKQDYSSEISAELTYFHRLVKKENPVASENKVSTTSEDWPQDLSGSNYLVSSNEQYRKKFYTKQSLASQSHFELKTRQKIDDSPKKAYKNHQRKQENRQVDFLEEKSFFSTRYSSKNNKVHDLLPRYDGRLEPNSSQKMTKLKSCVKKANSIPKPKGYRVRFALDEDDHKMLQLEFQRLSTE